MTDRWKLSRRVAGVEQRTATAYGTGSRASGTQTQSAESAATMPGVLQPPSAAIAVFEREPYWAPELQRQFGADVAVRTFSRLESLAEWLAGWPAGMALVELDADPAAVLNWLGRSVNHPSARPVLVMGSSWTAPLEPLVRELGAVAFHPHVVPGRLLARQCRAIFSAATTPDWRVLVQSSSLSE